MGVAVVHCMMVILAIKPVVVEDNHEGLATLSHIGGPGFDTTWFTNSRATNHITLDMNNLLGPEEYSGHGRVHMGNGIGLTI